MLCSVPIFAVMVDNLGERGAHFVAFKDYIDISKERVKASKWKYFSSFITPLATVGTVAVAASVIITLIKSRK